MVTEQPVVAIRVEDHLAWSRGVARGVARSYRFDRLSQEESDLEQEAAVALVRTAKAFTLDRVPEGGDVLGAFRGYAHRELQSQCRREARRLRNGGTYRTRREQGKLPILAGPFSDMDQSGGDTFEPEDHRSRHDEPETEELP